MNVEALKKEIRERESVIDAQRDAITLLKQSIADHLCPFRVGDKVTSPEGETVTIESIIYSRLAPCGYVGSIRRFKKDGAPYVYPNDCYALEDYKKYIEPEGE